jgi:hypothetical protein
MQESEGKKSTSRCSKPRKLDIKLSRFIMSERKTQVIRSKGKVEQWLSEGTGDSDPSLGTKWLDVQKEDNDVLFF